MKHLDRLFRGLAALVVIAALMGTIAKLCIWISLGGIWAWGTLIILVLAYILGTELENDPKKSKRTSLKWVID